MGQEGDLVAERSQQLLSKTRRRHLPSRSLMEAHKARTQTDLFDYPYYEPVDLASPFGEPEKDALALSSSLQDLPSSHHVSPPLEETDEPQRHSHSHSSPPKEEAQMKSPLYPEEEGVDGSSSVPSSSPSDGEEGEHSLMASRVSPPAREEEGTNTPTHAMLPSAHPPPRKENSPMPPETGDSEKKRKKKEEKGEKREKNHRSLTKEKMQEQEQSLGDDSDSTLPPSSTPLALSLEQVPSQPEELSRSSSVPNEVVLSPRARPPLEGTPRPVVEEDEGNKEDELPLLPPLEELPASVVMHHRLESPSTKSTSSPARGRARTAWMFEGLTPRQVQEESDSFTPILVEGRRMSVCEYKELFEPVPVPPVPVVGHGRRPSLNDRNYRLKPPSSQEIQNRVSQFESSLNT